MHIQLPPCFLRAFLLLLTLLSFTACQEEVFGVFGRFNGTLQVTLKTSGSVTLDISQLKGSITTALIGEGDVELRKVLLEYRVARLNINDCLSKISTCQPSTTPSCQETPVSCPALQQSCPEMITTCQPLLRDCPNVYTRCKQLLAACPADDPQCQVTPSGCRAVLRECEERNLCPWTVEGEERLIKCITIPEIRLSEALERCASQVDNDKSCHLESKTTKEVGLSLASESDGYTPTTSAQWRAPCSVSDTAQLLMFVSFKDDEITSSSLRPETASTPAFTLTCTLP